MNLMDKIDVCPILAEEGPALRGVDGVRSRGLPSPFIPGLEWDGSPGGASPGALRGPRALRLAAPSPRHAACRSASRRRRAEKQGWREGGASRSVGGAGTERGARRGAQS